MKVAGNATLNAPVDKVWSTMLDPAVLARTIPGCERLETTGENRYKGAITAGVASIKGTFLGDVELTDLEQPSSLVLRASGAGAPGTVQADVAVKLADLGDGRTELTYDASAVVGGMVGGVGQRVLTGVAKKMAGQFFSAVDGELTGTAAAPAVSEQAGPPEAVEAAGSAQAATYPGRAAAAAQPGRSAQPGSADDFVKGTVLGAAIALAGVLVGVLAGRKGRRS